MNRQYRILMVSSSGGVFLDLLALKPWWNQHHVTWALVKAADTQTSELGGQVFWFAERSASRPWGVVPAFSKAWRFLRRERPELVVSAGSGVAIAFFLAARILRIPCFWLETFNFISGSAITGKICARLASEVLIQRESMLRTHPRGVLLGELY